VDDIARLADLARGRRIVALTGAGCSTESGIPDYRGPGARPRTPMQHREFVEHEHARRRYWARSTLGWPRMATAKPNAAHDAIATLETSGQLTGVITQNVDGLHHAAGSRAVIELHGSLARVKCLGCDAITSRRLLQRRLLVANPSFATFAISARIAPDGDFELPEELVDGFEVPRCADCGGVLMPDVVFFGGSVPKPTLDQAWALLERAELLIVIGSSLAVFSGYRFVRRAAEGGVPIAIVNRGPTRGDAHAQLRLDARAGDALPRLALALQQSACA
jgi:NAD-dependent deacetylase sirtuin 4